MSDHDPITESVVRAALSEVRSSPRRAARPECRISGPSATVPLLGELPFEEPVVEGEDRGAPPVLEHPGSAVASAFRGLAQRVLAGLGFAQAGEDGRATGLHAGSAGGGGDRRLEGA